MNDYTKQKKILFKKFNGRCNNCDIKYEKYMYVFNKKLLCKACYMINKHNLLTYNQFNIYYSKLSQKEIINRTIDFIKEFNKIPDPKIIDNDVLDVELSIIEYFNILNSGLKNELLNNLKLFFNKNFDFSFVDNNLFSFIDDNDGEFQKLKLYKFTDKDNQFLNKHFASNT
jgi:hypothetical protein